MAYPPAVFEKAREILDARRIKAESEASRREMEFSALEPDYRKYKRVLGETAGQLIGILGADPENARALVEKLSKENLATREKITALLKKHNLPEDALEPAYMCKECEDTGINGNHLCKCHTELLKQIAFKEAGKKSPLKTSSFADFRLDWYPDKKPAGGGRSARDIMRDNFAYCTAYASSFDELSPNILMSGKTGLGKTHLSLAIAGEVIKSGKSVIYNSSQNIFNSISKERFSASGDGYEEMVLTCDLLVLDDLGDEFQTQLTTSILSNIINTRINNMRPTIISTNLDLKGLEERYDARIVSRIIGEYDHLVFEGSDIRQLKKNQ